MSISTDIQTAIFERLTSAISVTALVGQRVYDAPDKDSVWPYISFGPSDQVPDDILCIEGQTHSLQIDAWSKATDGQREAKLIVDAVRKALHLYPIDLGAGAVLVMRVIIARVLPDPATGVTHGVVALEIEAEEA
ncbi:hypothetical protein GCM10010873_26620 [Cypionkella aquatica]|uniref:DUF3168 domain-containing protein n=1 Tax=Cypionkella aquatica TaxID=1756042 RepID=A0AA37TU90_9RHOB|nr:DUF3168 domain-containing protein [Cypionkella aquatica]GLS87688.1 hypothetical protein GCM10010873_26620 [Cypionkella aquatica]